MCDGSKLYTIDQFAKNVFRGGFVSLYLVSIAFAGNSEALQQESRLPAEALRAWNVVESQRSKQGVAYSVITSIDGQPKRRQVVYHLNEWWISHDLGADFEASQDDRVFIYGPTHEFVMSGDINQQSLSIQALANSAGTPSKTTASFIHNAREIVHCSTSFSGYPFHKFLDQAKVKAIESGFPDHPDWVTIQFDKPQTDTPPEASIQGSFTFDSANQWRLVEADIILSATIEGEIKQQRKVGRIEYIDGLNTITIESQWADGDTENLGAIQKTELVAIAGPSRDQFTIGHYGFEASSEPAIWQRGSTWLILFGILAIALAVYIKQKH